MDFNKKLRGISANAAGNAPQIIAIGELRQNLADFVRKAHEGAEFAITSHGELMARLVPPVTTRALRMPFGAVAGRIKIAPDFDETPADIIADMED